MNSSVLAVTAAALAVERVAYALIWTRPHRFLRACRQRLPGRAPVDVVAGLFGAFKVVQVVAFAVWCRVHGGSLAPETVGVATLAGGITIAVGQVLNVAVFRRLGRIGVFYGNRLGHDVAWQDGFPFSLVRHPQYVGTVMSIWGLFLAWRYPAPDWYALPLLESAYYLAGALLEGQHVPHALNPDFADAATVLDQPASRRRR